MEIVPVGAAPVNVLVTQRPALADAFEQTNTEVVRAVQVTLRAPLFRLARKRLALRKALALDAKQADERPQARDHMAHKQRDQHELAKLDQVPVRSVHSNHHGGTICCAQAVHCTLEHNARAVLFVVLVNNIKGHSLEFVALLCLVCSLVRFAAAIRLLSDEVTIVRTNRIASQALTAQR